MVRFLILLSVFGLDGSFLFAQFRRLLDVVVIYFSSSIYACILFFYALFALIPSINSGYLICGLKIC